MGPFNLSPSSQVYFRGFEGSLLQGPGGKAPQTGSVWPWAEGQGQWPGSRLSTVTAQSRILAGLPTLQAQRQEAALGTDRELLDSGPKSQPFPPDGAHGTAPPPCSTPLSLSHVFPRLRKYLEVGGDQVAGKMEH